ncbi:MAG: glutamate--cysteine ligase [Hyphomicrobiales bacterium]
MSIPSPDTPETSRPIEDLAQLTKFLEDGCKPQKAWRIGTEHEKFGFHLDDHSPLPYEGPNGIQAMLSGMHERFDWEPVMEGDNIIGLSDPETGGNVSLEPGGQFELSGAPLVHLHQTCSEVHTHLAQVREVAEELGIGFLGLGFSPKWTFEETPMMPKGRYKIMRAYMQKKGNLGRDMMFRSCTVQVNLDFASEADMIKKMRVGLALQPVATALFANSPFKEGVPNGYHSYRSHLWTDTDPDRTGMLPFVFDDDFSFERYTDYALDVPMYFVYRNGTYHDVSGENFRDFMQGKLPQLPGELPTLKDWSDHLTTIFPEVRMKQFIEMRGADGGPWRELCALPAFWVGLMYDQASLDAAWDLVKDWSVAEQQTLRDNVPKLALEAPFRSGTLLDVARETVEIAKAGLQARKKPDGMGNDERIYLNELEQIVESGMTPADRLLELYDTEWNGDIERVFTDCAY